MAGTYFLTEASKPGTFVTAGAASATLVTQNDGRQALIVGNDHATNKAYIALAASSDVPAGPQPAVPTAVVGSGILLGPGVSMILEGFRGSAGVIASGAATNITVQEL